MSKSDLQRHVAYGKLIALCCLTSTGLMANDRPKTNQHWAFIAPNKPNIPTIENRAWPQRQIDFFILAKLEDAGLKPAKPAGKRALIRRAYFDLIGLPPTGKEVETYVADKSLDAFTKIVDRLLASSHYGERWGRHWLDVARYGDSNGGDENHAYPLAWRYRNYVIGAFNRDLPYDKFLHEQIAGDLMPSAQLPATGFLAIGTKILAEKDPVKKRADIVDEQIDTLGRSIMGLTLGCARCHDHKFDPIPHKDYYALAGIFHSTSIEDRPLMTKETKPSRDTLIVELDRKIKLAKKNLTTKGALEWEAEKFSRGNVIIDKSSYGKEIGIISDPGNQDNFAEYDLDISREDTFYIRLRYAALRARPGKISVDGKMIVENAISKTTGGWYPKNQKWFTEGKVTLSSGNHKLRIESKPLMSHIDRIQLLPESSNIQALDKLEMQRTNLVAKTEKAEKVMAVREGKIADSKINLRGNPHDLGERIPRGFLSKISANERKLPDKRSGRLELANWLTDDKHPLTSRVMVNRIWRWHFGKAIVTSTDNFGIRGEYPTHPELLDYLAVTFVEKGWSIKELHREIMLSSTYQMAAGITGDRAESGDPENHLYWKRNIRRLEAEAIRDAILTVSGSLNPMPHLGAPPKVKAQDPSPSDIAINRKVYEQFPHRSVYLPVVRSHVYDFLTLLDFPNASTPVGNRNTTTVPTQALLMLNNPFLIEQAKKLATTAQTGPLNNLYIKLFARPATPKETEWANDFLKRYGKRQGDSAAWTALCQTLLISNEFVHVW